jgi:hypothetical protein
MKNPKWNWISISFAAGALSVLLIAGVPHASAQAPDAAERCEPDVMRLCSEFVPDRDRIVACLKAKRRQLSQSCLTALQPKRENTSKKSGRWMLALSFGVGEIAMATIAEREELVCHPRNRSKRLLGRRMHQRDVTRRRRSSRLKRAGFGQCRGILNAPSKLH